MFSSNRPVVSAPVAYEPQLVSSISKDITVTGSTDIVNVTESGILFSVGITVTTSISGTVPTVTLDITIDGGTTRAIELYTALISWPEKLKALMLTATNSFSGITANSRGRLIFGTPYLTSLQVAVNVTTAVGTAGVITAAVLRGVEL